MEKFNRALRGYDPEEVNAFLDQVITQVEKMIADGKEKDMKLVKLESLEQEMREAAKNLDFERAMELRDVLFELKSEQIYLNKK